MRRPLAWLAALPAMLAGTQTAHAFAYRIVFPQSGVRAHVLLATGHGYLAWLPVALAIGGAAALVGLAFAAADAARGRPIRELPPLAFALLPPCAFAAQELLELSLHTGSVAWHVFAEPTFLPGLAFQLPFAVLAYVAARLLLRAAVRLGRLLKRPRVAAAAPVLLHFWHRAATRLQPGRTFAPRGPPHVVAN